MGKEKKIVHIHHGEEKYRTVMHAGRHELIADEPESAGGQDSGPDPYDYLLMALGSCSVITLKMYAARKEWKLDEVFIELNHHKTESEKKSDSGEKRSKKDVIEMEIIVKGDLSEEQIERLVEISKKCPVHRTLKGEMEIITSGVKK